MKIYILTCINENSELVLCKPYKRIPTLAKADMYSEANSRYEELIKQNRPDAYIELDDMSACVGNEARCFNFKITEAEL